MAKRPPYANPVKTWADNPRLWAERLTAAGCPFCPMNPSGAFVELPASWVLIPEEAVLPGYVVLVSKTHVIEPYELPIRDRKRFWEDCMHTAEAVASVVDPVKTNYEIHGNTIPHLHMHIFPRHVGDPFERTPIDPHRVRMVRRSRDSIQALRAAIAGGEA